jgi:trimeric autotransporter adhesin
MTHFRAKNTAQFVCIAAAAFALVAGCGDDDSSAAPPSEEGGEGGEPVSSGGKQSTAGTGGSGGSSPVNHAGEMNPPVGGDGAGGETALPAELGWSSKFGVPGVSGGVTGTVNTFVLTGVRKLWAGGQFSLAGDVPASNVAIWNGQRWGALGDGLANPVRKLAATSDESMYALTEARADSGQLFFWDGETWTEIDASVDGLISDIAVGPDDTVYATGTFTTIDGVPAPGLAFLAPGESWQALPTDVAELGDITFDTIIAGEDRVCVGGYTGEVVGGVACLEEGAWVSYRANISNGGVKSLVEANGTLYAGGQFWLDGIDSGGGVAKWNGTSWELVGGGLTNGGAEAYVEAIAVDGDKVYATGRFDGAAGLQVRAIAMFDGERWGDLNGGLEIWLGDPFGIATPGRALAVDDGGELYVGGALTVAGAQGAFRIASWDGAEWNTVDDPTALRLGVNGSVSSVKAAADGSVYVGGGFLYLSGELQSLNAAHLVPAEGRWLPMGLGLNGQVFAWAEQGGSVFAGGQFNKSGTSTVKSIARWDGLTWRSVGGGTNGYITSLVTGPDDKLYAAGGFFDMGGAPARNAAVWDGTKWTALDLLGEEYESVDTLAFDDAGTLYAAGSFTTASGAPANNIASWQDGTWQPLGDGLDGQVKAMVSYDGKLVVGGYFTHSGEADVPLIAYWDTETETFLPLGGGLLPRDEFDFPSVTALAVHGKDLYVAGLLKVAGGVPVNLIARFDGKKWHDVDGGVDDVVESLSIGKDALWVGGAFARAGKYGSVGIARYGFAP